MNRSVLARSAVVGVALAALTIAGCSSNNPSTTPSAPATTANPYAALSGSLKFTGATFPQNFYNIPADGGPLTQLGTFNVAFTNRCINP